MGTELRIKDDGLDLTYIERREDHSTQELRQASTETENAFQIYKPKTIKINLTSQESALERLTKDIKDWITRSKVKKLALEITFYVENPDKKREYAVLNSDAAGNLNWIVKNIPEIETWPLDITFKTRNGEFCAKQVDFQDLKRAIEKLEDPKWLSARMKIYGYSWGWENETIPQISRCYVIKK